VEQGLTIPAIRAVLDSSAVLAVIFAEPGFERALFWSDGAGVSAVNVAEVVAKLLDKGATPDAIVAGWRRLGAVAVPFDEVLALDAGILRRDTRTANISPGDRACLATARRLGVPAVRPIGLGRVSMSAFKSR
jgi:PIN domain nuclease of toxin-antitoxin system